METKSYKLGGYLYCVKPVVMKNGKLEGKAVTKVGKHYKILDITKKRFYIRDESKRSHSFDFEDYGEWFIYTDKVIRGINKIVDNISSDFWE